jgi:hypothetical protein
MGPPVVARVKQTARLSEAERVALGKFDGADSRKEMRWKRREDYWAKQQEKDRRKLIKRVRESGKELAEIEAEIERIGALSGKEVIAELKALVAEEKRQDRIELLKKSVEELREMQAQDDREREEERERLRKKEERMEAKAKQEHDEWSSLSSSDSEDYVPKKPRKPKKPTVLPVKLQFGVADLMKKLKDLGYVFHEAIDGEWAEGEGQTEVDETTPAQVQWIWHTLHLCWQQDSKSWGRVDKTDMATFKGEKTKTEASPRFLSFWDNLLRRYELMTNGGREMAVNDDRLTMLNECVAILRFQWAWQENEKGMWKRGGFEVIEMAKKREVIVVEDEDE